MPERRPNLLYIMNDQHVADVLSCAGDPDVATPHLDRLAARGVRFSEAYCAYPLCVPDRTAMFTSRWPHESGIWGNCHVDNHDPGVPMLGALLAEAGYERHYIGKWHLTVGEHQSDLHGFEHIELGGGYGGTDQQKTAAAVRYLQERGDNDEPFFLVVSYNNPHDCCELARGDALRSQPLPPDPGPAAHPPLPANAAPPDREPGVLRAFQRDRPRIGLAAGWSEAETRAYRWGYRRLVEMVDAEIGAVLAALEAQGLAEDTLVFMASDHGDGDGRHHWNQKWSLYEESAKVPCILAGPGIPAGGVETTPVSATLDLMPTLLAAAGVEAPPQARGRNLLPLARGSGGYAADHIVVETTLADWGPIGEIGGPLGRAVRTATQKYIAFDSGDDPEQFFDLASDPGETRNLVDDPAWADAVFRHQQLLQAWCRETGDEWDGIVPR